MWRLQEQQPGDGSLTQGGTDAAINVLDPMNLIQGLHCILGKMVLQDSIQRVRGSEILDGDLLCHFPFCITG